jgi:hypothetical protein
MFITIVRAGAVGAASRYGSGSATLLQSELRAWVSCDVGSDCLVGEREGKKRAGREITKFCKTKFLRNLAEMLSREIS